MNEKTTGNSTYPALTVLLCWFIYKFVCTYSGDVTVDIITAFLLSVGLFILYSNKNDSDLARFKDPQSFIDEHSDKNDYENDE